MKRSERIAICRIIGDLIKADNIIDVGEMDMYARLKEKYSLTQDVEIEAVAMSLAKAVKTLQESAESLKRCLLNDCADLTVSDGFCAPQEAALMIALQNSLDDATDAEIISAYEPDLKIGERQVIYVENGYNETVNVEIKAHYRLLDAELRLAGFNLVYIPFVSKHYQAYNDTTFRQVTDFLAPYLSDTAKSTLRERLSNMTTAQFVREQLIDRLQMASLSNNSPSLLFKIGYDYVGDRLYGNFLRVGIANDITKIVRQLMDCYVGMLSSDKMVVSHTRESKGQFIYHGFYKQLFDMYTIRQGVEGSLVVNPYRGDLTIPEIENTIGGLQRKQKALYLLLLIESQRGGISFNQPATAKQLQYYHKRMDEVKLRYQKIYELIGGERAAAPDIERPEIRRPMIAIIRKNIALLENELRNASDFNIEKTEDGLFRIPMNPTQVKILTSNGYVSLKDFEI